VQVVSKYPRDDELQGDIPRRYSIRPHRSLLAATNSPERTTEEPLDRAEQATTNAPKDIPHLFNLLVPASLFPQISSPSPYLHYHGAPILHAALLASLQPASATHFNLQQQLYSGNKLGISLLLPRFLPSASLTRIGLLPVQLPRSNQVVPAPRLVASAFFFLFFLLWLHFAGDDIETASSKSDRVWLPQFLRGLSTLRHVITRDTTRQYSSSRGFAELARRRTILRAAGEITRHPKAPPF
jgi:hypothetical protein